MTHAYHWATAQPSSERERIRDTFRKLARQSRPIARFRANLDGAAVVDRDLWRIFSEVGATQILVAEQFGGLALSLRDALTVAEEIGRTLLPIPFVSAAVQVPAVLYALKPGVRRDHLLREIAAGSCLAGVAAQHAAHDTLKLDDLDRLNGTCLYAAPGPDADGWLVSAIGPKEKYLVWVDACAEGLRIEPVHRSNGTTLVHLHFAHVHIAEGDVVGQGAEVLRALEVSTAAARLGYAAELLGVARSAMALGIDYLKTRVQFGKPIGSFQALQHKAADVLIEIETAAACLVHCADTIATKPEQLVAEAARAKARCARAALKAARFAIQVHGAMGITHACDAGLYLKAALHLSSYLGTVGELQRIHFDSRQITDAPAGDTENVSSGDIDLISASERDFRLAIRTFVKEHCPQNILHLPRSPSWPEYKTWYQALSRRGWIAPAWPRSHGGLGLPPDKLLAFYEELENMGVSKGPELGLSMVGPLLIHYGTPEQQAKYLPGILSGEDVWCQGYSEPGAGSDLACLRTSAVLEKDEYVITGQKIWTTYAMYATHIFMLVRTEQTGRKQEGISFMLVKMDSPGIAVRPIKDIGGHEKFCEVFFDQVRVSADALVGQANQGWSMAKALLGYERLMIGSPKQVVYILGQLQKVGCVRGLFTSSAFVAEFADLQLQVRDVQALYSHFAEIFRRGEPIPPAIAVLKVAVTELFQRLCERLIEHSGEAGGSWGMQDIAGAQVDPVGQLLMSLPASIYGGTNEIQRNILAKAVLELP